MKSKHLSQPVAINHNHYILEVKKGQKPMQYVIAVLLALFFDFLEFSQKYDDKVREEEARHRAEAEKAAQSPTPCPLCGRTSR